MDTKNNFYFAYGSNLWKNQMRERCPESKYIGFARLNDYKWFINKRRYANIVHSVGDYVLGSVYEISSADEKWLDQKEGVAIGSYYKKQVGVLINNNMVNCLVYIDPVVDIGLPSDDYFEKLQKGFIDARIPKDYLEKYVIIYFTEEQKISLNP